VCFQSLTTLWVAVMKPPLAANGRSAAALEPVDAAVELGVREHRLDHCLARAVERAAMLGGQNAAFVGVGATRAAIPSLTMRSVCTWCGLLGSGSTSRARLAMRFRSHLLAESRRLLA
jgi:hypothetical protein